MPSVEPSSAIMITSGGAILREQRVDGRREHERLVVRGDDHAERPDVGRRGRRAVVREQRQRPPEDEGQQRRVVADVDEAGRPGEEVREPEGGGEEPGPEREDGAVDDDARDRRRAGRRAGRPAEPGGLQRRGVARCGHRRRRVVRNHPGLTLRRTRGMAMVLSVDKGSRIHDDGRDAAERRPPLFGRGDGVPLGDRRPDGAQPRPRLVRRALAGELGPPGDRHPQVDRRHRSRPRPAADPVARGPRAAAAARHLCAMGEVGRPRRAHAPLRGDARVAALGLDARFGVERGRHPSHAPLRPRALAADRLDHRDRAGA